jgi:4-aminobutyrate aminotransferase
MRQVPDIKTALPGPKAAAIIARDNQFVSPSYTRDYPFVMAGGAGAVVEDVDGNVFLDCAAGIAVNGTGHSHPDVVKAITEQAKKYLHMSGTDFYYEPQVQLAEQIAQIVPVGGGTGQVRSFFSNSGAEAVEAALKLAKYSTKRYNVIAFLGSFPRPHHRGDGGHVIQIRATPRLRSDDARRLSRTVRQLLSLPGRSEPESCEAECLAFVEEQILVHLVSPDEVAAVLVEPIQGEGGYVVPPAKFLQRLRALTSKHGMLLIADEVQSGMGRTGRMFACEHFGLDVDIVTIAKGIASGLPLGITAARADVMTWPPGAHASTFGGNPVSSASALATIKILKDGLVKNAETVGAHLLGRLQALKDTHTLIGDVRGKGLMIGVELVRDRVTKERATTERDRLVHEMFKRGVLILGAGRNAIRFAPPLVLTTDQADTIVALFDESLAALSRA